MKTAFGFSMAVFLAATFSPLYGSVVSLKPWFVPDQLLFSLSRGSGVPDQQVLDAIYTAAGVVELRPLSGVWLGEQVQIKPGVGLGHAFQAIQRFSFAEFPGWSLRYVEPNHLFFLPENMPLSGNRLFNFSARADVGVGSSVTIGGMVVPGEYPRLVVFKVRGASLAQFAVERPLADPQMRLFEGNALVLSNDNWTTLRDWEKNVARTVCPAPDDVREAMIVTYLDPGIYTAVVSGADGGTGNALLEMYLQDSFIVQ